MVLTSFEPTVYITAYLLGVLVTYKIRRTAIDRDLAIARLIITGVGGPRDGLMRLPRRLALGLVAVSIVWPLTWVLRLAGEIVWKVASPSQRDAMWRRCHPKPRRPRKA